MIITFQVSQRPGSNWKSVNATLICRKEDTRSYKAVSLTSVPEKITEQILMEGTCRYMMDKTASKKACLDSPKINQSQYLLQ